jgi:hypothetical protein
MAAKACSHVHGLLHDAVTDMAIQFVLGYQFHRALQKVCEFLRQGQTLREQVVTSRACSH